MPVSGPVIEQSLSMLAAAVSGPTLDEQLTILPAAFSGPTLDGNLSLLPVAFSGPTMDGPLVLSPQFASAVSEHVMDVAVFTSASPSYELTLTAVSRTASPAFERFMEVSTGLQTGLKRPNRPYRDRRFAVLGPIKDQP